MSPATDKLGALRAKTGKAAAYPTKRTINLVPQEEAFRVTPRLIVGTLIGALAVLLFIKFAIFDVIGAAVSAEAKLSSAQRELTALEQANADYDDIQRQIAEYGAMGISSEERKIVYRADVLSLISSTVGTRTDVLYVSATGNSVEIRFLDISLSDASNVIAMLEASPLVDSVEMSTSKSNAKSSVVSTIYVTLREAGGSDQAKGATK